MCVPSMSSFFSLSLTSADLLLILEMFKKHKKSNQVLIKPEGQIDPEVGPEPTAQSDPLSPDP